MEKILRRDSDGFLVYIIPTKALVNQIGAEVYASFSKKYCGGVAVYKVKLLDHNTPQ